MGNIEILLKDVAAGKVSADDAIEELKYLPFKNIGCAKIDTHRILRKGFPEVIYAPGKTQGEIKAITSNLIKLNQPILITRANRKIFNALKKYFKGLKFSKRAGLIYAGHSKNRKKGVILVVSAGTADTPVAEEAAITAELAGCRVKRLYDVGVAGIHRVLGNKKEIDSADILVVVAGMEGALPSVVGGMTDKPVIAVPTSIGYGSNFKGLAPLLAMLNCCAPGVAVVNIDNGFGAGYFAALIAK